MNVLFNLKQKERSLRKYFDETREIDRFMFSEIKSQTFLRLIVELNDSIIRSIIETYINNSNSKIDSLNLERTIEVIKNTIKIDEKKNKSFNDDISNDAKELKFSKKVLM